MLSRESSELVCDWSVFDAYFLNERASNESTRCDSVTSSHLSHLSHLSQASSNGSSNFSSSSSVSHSVHSVHSVHSAHSSHSSHSSQSYPRQLTPQTAQNKLIFDESDLQFISVMPSMQKNEKLVKVEKMVKDGKNEKKEKKEKKEGKSEKIGLCDQSKDGSSKSSKSIGKLKDNVDSDVATSLQKYGLELNTSTKVEELTEFENTLYQNAVWKTMLQNPNAFHNLRGKLKNDT